MGFLCNLLGHKWTGCKCDRCGELRDEEHDWNGCTCRICGKVLDETQMANDILSRYADWHTENQRRNNLLSRHETDVFAFELVNTARNNLPKSEADNVLLAWLMGLALDGELLQGLGQDKFYTLSDEYSSVTYSRPEYARRYRQEDDAKRKLKRLPKDLWSPIREADLPLLRRFFLEIQEKSVNQNVDNTLRSFEKLCDIALAERFTPEQIMVECIESGWDYSQTREYLLALRIADGRITSPCDFGQHEWEYVEGHTESAEGEASDLWHIDYITYRCKNCGITETRNTRR